jgi:ATP-binding cassette subfamily B protein/ATP-binding cassette subfamily C protein LapB
MIPQRSDDFAEGLPAEAATMEEAAQLLFARLKAASWGVAPEDEPLALCFCLLVLRLDPTIHPRTVAAILQGTKGHAFDATTLVNAMASLGFRYLRLTLHPGSLDQRVLPALLRPSGKAPRVLYAEGRRLYHFDGRSASHIPARERLSPCEVYVFSRQMEEDLPTSRPMRAATGRTWFYALLWRFAPQMRLMLFIAMGLNLLSLAVPVLILSVHALVVSTGDVGPLTYLSLGAALVVGVEFLLRRLRSSFATWMTARLDYLVGCANFEKLLNLPAATLEGAELSAQIARIKSFEAVRDFLTGPLMASAMELPMSVLSLFLLYYLGGSLVLPVFAVMMALVILILVTRRQTAVAMRMAANEGSRMQQFTLESFAKLEAIRADGLGQRWLQRYRDLSGREQMALMRLGNIGVMAELVAHGLVGLSTLLVLFVGAHLIWANVIGTGVLIAAVTLQLRALSPLHATVGMVGRLEQLRNSIAQIDELMDLEEEETAERRSIATFKLSGHLQFANVALRYDNKAPLIFSGFSLDVAEGEVIGIAGPNGSGKSSLLKMPLGLVVPQLGGVRLGGFDIRQLNPIDLREQIAYVPQYVDLFSGTLAENLRICLPIAREREIEEALAEAGALEMIRAMPGGIHSMIDPPRIAATLPLLRERIGLARALLRPASLMLIDERPAAMLLEGFDEDLRRVLARRRGERTILFVTHRTDFLRLADRVVALTGEGTAHVGPLDKIMGVL